MLILKSSKLIHNAETDGHSSVAETSWFPHSHIHLQENLVVRKKAVHSQGGGKIGKVRFSNAVQGTSCNMKACSLAQNLLTGLPS